MDSAGLRWYRTGTVNITQGSTNITGVGTNWQTAGIQPGDVFMVGNSVLYEIAQVADNTNIVLNSAFQGTTGTGQNYSIIRNFAGTMQAQIAAQVSELVNKYESYIDTELQQIVGPPGPSSFPYRGTWATGREYNALDVVEYSRLLYMAVAGHVSTSENAPGAANTEWMVLQVASGAVTTTFVNGAAIVPNGTYGLTLAGNAAERNIITNITPAGITIQSEESGGTTTQATFVPENDTGWIAVEPLNNVDYGIRYRRCNGIIYLMPMCDRAYTSTGNTWDLVAKLPEDARPTTSEIRAACAFDWGINSAGCVSILTSGDLYINTPVAVSNVGFWFLISYPA